MTDTERDEKAEDEGASKKAMPQATRLLNLANEKGNGLELFVTPNGLPCASVLIGDEGSRETWAVRSSGFRTWLARLFQKHEERIPRAQALQDAVSQLHGEAGLARSIVEAPVRFAAHGDAIYLDLADEKRRVAEVTASGWRIVNDTPVRFRRTRGLLSLPVPEYGGSLGAFVDLVNVTGDKAAHQVTTWLLSTVQPTGPLPILVIGGEQGTAKSSLGLILKQLVDPSAAPLRAEPREIGDLMIAATNARVVAFDNLSSIAPWLSDALCRLSTGGGFAKRELYSDGDEVILEARRPVVLTGIEDLATRPDLLDRAIIINLQPIPANRRRTEEDLQHDFAAVHPRILGALLDAAASGLRNRQRVRFSALPRMGDFAAWFSACAPALGIEPGVLLSAYEENRANANSLALDSTPVAARLLAVIGEGFEGSATELLRRLETGMPEEATRHRGWPKDGARLSAALRRISSNLRVAGVEVTFDPSREKRVIRIARSPAPRDGDATLRDAGVTRRDAEKLASVTPELNGSHEDAPSRDAGDAGDAISPHSSASPTNVQPSPRPAPELVAAGPVEVDSAAVDAMERHLRGAGS